MTKYADYLAKHTQDGAQGELLRTPTPPNYKPGKQGPGQGVSGAIQGNVSEADQLAEHRLNYRCVLYVGSFYIYKHAL